LPVELTSFGIRENGCDVLLNWTSESETDFSHYIIEKSSNGVDFEYVEKVLPSPAEGMKSYSYIQRDVIDRKFFRLKLVDMDGSYNYSDIVVATTNCKDQISDLKLFPNPIGVEQSNINVKFLNNSESVVWVLMSDMLGNEVMKYPVDAKVGNNTIEFDVTDISEGIYYITIRKSKGKSLSQKFIKIRK